MTTVQFKKNASAAVVSFSAVSILPDYVKDTFAYTDSLYNRGEIIAASWKKWGIRLGFVSEADMDYLNELKKESAPQMILDATTYEIQIERVTPRRTGSFISVINKVSE